MNIRNFKKGDVITRVEPSLEIFGWFTGDKLFGDRSYMGDPLEFVGMANGCAYFKRLKNIDVLIFGDSLLDISLDAFADGWELYVDPKSLLEVDYSQKVDIRVLENELQKAIDSENYELAETIKQKIKTNKHGN